MGSSYTRRMRHLMSLFLRSKRVRQLGMEHEDPSEEAEAGALAHALLDIEESTHRIYDELLPQITRGQPRGKTIEKCLFDIAEELRHVMYHIRDPLFFRHVRDE